MHEWFIIDSFSCMYIYDVFQSVRAMPTSVRIWIKAADLEMDLKSKKKVFRKGSLIFSWSRSVVQMDSL